MNHVDSQYCMTSCVPVAMLYPLPVSQEVAWVGKTEEALKQEDVKFRVGKFPMSANSRAKTNGTSHSLLSLVYLLVYLFVCLLVCVCSGH